MNFWRSLIDFLVGLFSMREFLLIDAAIDLSIAIIRVTYELIQVFVQFRPTII